MKDGLEHAVVLGGSMAGLVAARVLSDHFAQVTVIERDALDDVGVPRKGVPQGRHVHVLLAAGMQALERLFPNLKQAALARGALEYDIGQYGTVYMRGHEMPRVETGHRTLMLSRPLLESCVREQLRTRPNVSIRGGHVAESLVGDKRRVVGVSIVALGQKRAETLLADLVVDATGRGSKTPVWLGPLGVPAVTEETVRARVSYASCTVARKPEHLRGQPGWALPPSPPRKLFAAAQRLEGERFIVMFMSYLGERCPESYEAMLDKARGLPFSGMHELLEDTEPASDVVHMSDPMSRRRRYDRIERFPEGLLVMGDAFCSFNPAYGQGMTVAALEAEALGRCLRRGTHELPKRYFREAAKIVNVPWLLAAGGDFQWPEVEGRRPSITPLVNRAIAGVIALAAREPEVMKALLRVTHLLESPTAMLAPTVVRRALLSALPRSSVQRALGNLAPSWL